MHNSVTGVASERAKVWGKKRLPFRRKICFQLHFCADVVIAARDKHFLAKHLVEFSLTTRGHSRGICRTRRRSLIAHTRVRNVCTGSARDALPPKQGRSTLFRRAVYAGSPRSLEEHTLTIITAHQNQPQSLQTLPTNPRRSRPSEEILIFIKAVQLNFLRGYFLVFSHARYN